MNPKYIKFTKAVLELRLTGPDRSFTIAAAVASAVADYVDVPATPSATPSTIFHTLAAMPIRQAVGAFNEASPFDMRLALELARKFWMVRYETVHTRRLHDAQEGDYFCGYFNVKRNFSSSEIGQLNCFSKEINILEIYTREIMQCMRDEATKAPSQGDGAIASSPVGMPVL